MTFKLTPGMKSSEALVMVLTALLNIVNNAADWTSFRNALLASLAPLGYIVSRGLAKTEPRPPEGPSSG